MFVSAIANPTMHTNHKTRHTKKKWELNPAPGQLSTCRRVAGAQSVCVCSRCLAYGPAPRLWMAWSWRQWKSQFHFIIKLPREQFAFSFSRSPTGYCLAWSVVRSHIIHFMRHALPFAMAAYTRTRTRTPSIDMFESVHWTIERNEDRKKIKCPWLAHSLS